MPNWKKVITSGSNAHLNHITASGKVAIGDDLYINDAGYTTWLRNNGMEGFQIGSGSIQGSNVLMQFHQGGNIRVGSAASIPPVHRFEVVGSISSSGIVYASRFMVDDIKYIDTSPNISSYLYTSTGLQTEGSLVVGSAVSPSNITASNNISASGDVNGDRFYTADRLAIDYVPAADAIKFGNLTNKTTIRGAASAGGVLVGTNVAQAVTIGGHLTASYNISASEYVYSKGVRRFTGDLQFQGDSIQNIIDSTAGETWKVDSGADTIFEISTQGNITASGNISSSGELQASTVRLKAGANSYLAQSSGTVTLKSADTSISLIGNVTASNNISASGTITAEHIVSSDDLVVTDQIEAKGMTLEGAGSTTKLTINNTGASSIDSIINFQKSGATNWAIGGDGADNHFKIDSGDSFVGDPVFKIDASGNATITGKITADSAEVEGGEIEIKNGGTPSNVKLYCESSNAHFTQLQATSHSNYSGNVITTLPAYAFDFNNPDFQTDVTVTGDISASGIIHSSASIKPNLTKLVTYDDATGIFHITASSQFLGSGGGGGGTTTNALTAGPGLTSGGTFNGGAARTFSVDSASMGGFYSASMNNFTTNGTITAGGDFVQSGPGAGHFISSSNGNFELSGSGTAFLVVDGNISASSGISASSANLGSRVDADVVQTGRVNVDNITLNGAAIVSDSTLELDAVGDITIDAGGGDILFKDDVATITATLNSSSLGVLGNVSSSGNFETLHSGSFGHIHTTGNISSSGIIHSSASIKSNLTKLVTYDDATGIFHITASTGFVNGAGGGGSGDIEGVTAGTSLNGGGSSGTVTLNLDTDIDTVTDLHNTSLQIGRDGDNQLDFRIDDEINFTVAGDTAAVLKGSNDSGSIAVSGSVKIQPQELIPSISESRLYNVTSENGNYVDDLHFGTAGLTPAYAWVSLDDDGTSGTGEMIFGVGTSAVTSTSYNMVVTHDSSTNGVRIHSQLDGVYKVVGAWVIRDGSADFDCDINVDGSTVHTIQARIHSAVDPVERTQQYVGTINSGSYVTAHLDATSTVNVSYDPGSTILVERLS